MKGWPDRKAALSITFRIQELYYEREVLRLEHLKESTLDDAVWNSFTTIKSVRERLEGGWKTSEEDCMSRLAGRYAEITTELQDLKAITDRAATDGPFDMAQLDPDLVAAANAFKQRHLELDQRLSV
jgi:hypothetical protein